MAKVGRRGGIDAAMERVLGRFDDRDLDGARREIDRMVDEFGPTPEVSYVRGLLRLEEEDEEAAFELLVQAFRNDSTLVDAGLTALDLADDQTEADLIVELTDRLATMELSSDERSDVLYRSALAWREKGDEDRARDLFLQVWELDRRRRRRRGVPRVSLRNFDRMVRGAIEQLPDPIRLRIESVPVIVQDRPDRDTVEQGFDPRSLGMFDGIPYGEQGSVPALTRILIFQRNLEEVVEGETALEEEVYVTLLHETGHFFGLSEEDLDRRGLA